MSSGQIIFLFAYALVGPGAMLGLLISTLFGRKRMSRLTEKRYEIPKDPPGVTIVVPAKDEGEGIRECIERCLAQDYPRFNVIAVDDRSSDQTGAVLDRLAAECAGRLRVIHIAPEALPEGWVGKCNALHRGVEGISCDWILFVDSDVKLQRDALSRAIGISVEREYDALSLLTRLECVAFIDELMLPVTAGAWAMMFTASLTNDDSKPRIAVGNGQFFLIRRDTYESVGGHGAVRDQIVEDVELMRLMKGQGHCVRFMLGPHLASTRMHSTLKQIFSGWSRIYAGTSRRRPARIVIAMLFVILCGLSVYPALLAGVWRLDFAQDASPLTLAATHLVLLTVLLAVLYRGSGNRRRNMFLFFISGSLLVGIFARALKICRTGRVTWRGTEVTWRGSEIGPATLPLRPSARDSDSAKTAAAAGSNTSASA